MAMGKAAKAEFSRGLKQSREQIKVLQEKWPAGFPIVPSKVRPLASGAVKTIAEALGWTLPYTRGVLLSWKSRTNYCNAVLRYRERINLDGLASGEEVDDRARVDAQQQLAQIACRAAERAAAEQAARTAAEAETAAAEVTPAPAPAPPPEPPAETPIEPPAAMVIETPEQLRAHLRASLLRRRA